MNEHKCLVCDTIYLNDEPGYWGYCSKECREFSAAIAQANAKRAAKEVQNEGK